MTTYFAIKRVIDLVGAVLFIVLFSPVYLFFFVVIYLTDFHNPIYRQVRVGRNKRNYRTYKFRSMVVDADQIMMQDQKLYEQLRSNNNKIKDDPRVTKVGKFIRRYSIDEFPQMFNVLLGDMSIVGPRPLRPDEYDLYANKSEGNKSKLELISTVKPGITGYWQTHGRSNVGFDKRVEMECGYASKKSILLDINIIFLTPYAMIKGDGAY